MKRYKSKRRSNRKNHRRSNRRSYKKSNKKSNRRSKRVLIGGSSIYGQAALGRTQMPDPIRGKALRNETAKEKKDRWTEMATTDIETWKEEARAAREARVARSSGKPRAASRTGTLSDEFVERLLTPGTPEFSARGGRSGKRIDASDEQPYDFASFQEEYGPQAEELWSIAERTAGGKSKAKPKGKNPGRGGGGGEFERRVSTAADRRARMALLSRVEAATEYAVEPSPETEATLRRENEELKRQIEALKRASGDQ
jgi:hypothetical protein